MLIPDNVGKIINAVLYEGYMLYPYRQSALKNRHRWNFGVLFPESYSATHAPAETSTMQTECVLLGEDHTALTAGVRFLHLPPEGTERGAVEREITTPAMKLAQLVGEKSILAFVCADDRNADRSATTVVPVSGEIEISAAPAAEKAYRLTVRVRNTTSLDAAPAGRDRALPFALVSTHIILHATSGEFVSLIDPPKEHAEAAAVCRNIGAWPVLVGDPGERQWMLASPIILYDYPQIAPESPGDFFDGTEIDELLTLRVLTLTEEEKQELRRGDRRAREILDRSETLPEDHLLKLHGALRGMDK